MSFSPFTPQQAPGNPYEGIYNTPNTGPANPQGEPTPGGSSAITGDPALDEDLRALGLTGADLQGASEAVLRFIAGQVATRRGATPATPANPGIANAAAGSASGPAPTPPPPVPPPAVVPPAVGGVAATPTPGSMTDPTVLAAAVARMQQYVNTYLAIPVAKRTPAQNAALAGDQATLLQAQKNLAAAVPPPPATDPSLGAPRPTGLTGAIVAAPVQNTSTPAAPTVSQPLQTTASTPPPVNTTVAPVVAQPVTTATGPYPSAEAMKTGLISSPSDLLAWLKKAAAGGIGQVQLPSGEYWGTNPETIAQTEANIAQAASTRASRE